MTASILVQKARPEGQLPADIYGDIPEQFRTQQAPRDPALRVEYYNAWIQHIKTTPRFSETDKRSILKKFYIKRTQAEAAQGNGHRCECCGRLLTKTEGPLGPCCSQPGHPPCRKEIER